MTGKIATAASFVFIVFVMVSCSATIPPALLVCKDEPVYSGRKNVSAADLLEFTDQVAVAGADCRARLKAVEKDCRRQKLKPPVTVSTGAFDVDVM